MMDPSVRPGPARSICRPNRDKPFSTGIPILPLIIFRMSSSCWIEVSPRGRSLRDPIPPQNLLNSEEIRLTERKFKPNSPVPSSQLLPFLNHELFIIEKVN